MALHSGLMFYFKEASKQHVLLFILFCCKHGSDELNSPICKAE